MRFDMKFKFLSFFVLCFLGTSLQITAGAPFEDQSPASLLESEPISTPTKPDVPVTDITLKTENATEEDLSLGREKRTLLGLFSHHDGYTKKPLYFNHVKKYNINFGFGLRTNYKTQRYQPTQYRNSRYQNTQYKITKQRGSSRGRKSSRRHSLRRHSNRFSRNSNKRKGYSRGGKKSVRHSKHGKSSKRKSSRKKHRSYNSRKDSKGSRKSRKNYKKKKSGRKSKGKKHSSRGQSNNSRRRYEPRPTVYTQPKRYPQAVPPEVEYQEATETYNMKTDDEAPEDDQY